MILYMNNILLRGELVQFLDSRGTTALTMNKETLLNPGNAIVRLLPEIQEDFLIKNLGYERILDRSAFRLAIHRVSPWRWTGRFRHIRE